MLLLSTEYCIVQCIPQVSYIAELGPWSPSRNWIRSAPNLISMSCDNGILDIKMSSTTYACLGVVSQVTQSHMTLVYTMYLFKHECSFNAISKDIFGMQVAEDFEEQLWFSTCTRTNHLP